MSIFKNKHYFLFFLFYLTLLIGFFFGEDSLGGAKHDYLYHLKFIDLFKDNTFSVAFKKYSKLNYETRNSPVFYIIFASLNKFISLEILRLFNSFISVFLAIIFYKCLKIKYKKQSKLILILISCVIFLSPTVRSLSIWPYPLLWGIFFFNCSIFFFLNYLESKNDKKKKLFSIICTILIIIAAYIHPPLGLFNFFYLFYFYKNLKVKEILLIILINILFAFPVIVFLNEQGIFYYQAIPGENVDIYTSLNLSNKIIIISTIILYYLIPCLNLVELFREMLKKINLNKLFIFFLITLFCSQFFNYNYTNIHGGGYVHKISYILFGNYIFLYITFLFSIIVFYTIFKNNFKNYFIYFLLIFTNIQYTIYNKYFDILILIVFFLLANISMKERFFQNKFNIINLYFFYSAYYCINLFRGNIYNLF